jgi:hypothetical protein
MTTGSLGCWDATDAPASGRRLSGAAIPNAHASRLLRRCEGGDSDGPVWPLRKRGCRDDPDIESELGKSAAEIARPPRTADADVDLITRSSDRLLTTHSPLLSAGKTLENLGGAALIGGIQSPDRALAGCCDGGCFSRVRRVVRDEVDELIIA